MMIFFLTVLRNKYSVKRALERSPALRMTARSKPLPTHSPR